MSPPFFLTFTIINFPLSFFCLLSLCLPVCLVLTGFYQNEPVRQSQIRRTRWYETLYASNFQGFLFGRQGSCAFISAVKNIVLINTPPHKCITTVSTKTRTGYPYISSGRSCPCRGPLWPGTRAKALSKNSSSIPSPAENASPCYSLS